MRTAKKNNKTVSFLINRYRRIIYSARLLRSTLLWLVLSVLLLLVIFQADNYFQLPGSWRLVLLLAYLTVVIWGLIKTVLLPFMWKKNLDAVALELESYCGLDDNLLINSLQFENRNTINGPLRLRQLEKPFADTAVSTAIAYARDINSGGLRNYKAIFWTVTALFAVGALWGGYCYSSPRYAVNALSRFFSPLSDIPPAGKAIVSVMPSDSISVVQGDDLEIQIMVTSMVDGYQLTKYPDIVSKENCEFIKTDSAMSSDPSFSTVPVSAMTDDLFTYTYRFRNIQNDFAFRVFAADTCSRSVAVKVDRMPRVVKVSFDVVMPEYTGRGVENRQLSEKNNALLTGSKVELHFKLDRPVAKLSFELGEMLVECDGSDKEWKGNFVFGQSSVVKVYGDYLPVDRQVKLGEYTLVTASDNSPSVEFGVDTLNMLCDPGSRLNIPVRIFDDYGVRLFGVTMEKSGSMQAAEVLKSVIYPGPPGNLANDENILLSLDSGRFMPGDSYILRASCEDFCPDSKAGEARPLVITVRGLDEILLSSESEFSAAFELLDKAIVAQKAAISAGRNISANIEDIITEDWDMSRKNLEGQRDGLLAGQQQVGVDLAAAYDASPEPKPDFAHEIDQLNSGLQQRVLSKIVVLAAQRNPDRDISVLSLQAIAELQQFMLDRLIAIRTGIARADEKSLIVAQGENTEADETITETLDDAVADLKVELDNFVTSQQQIMNKRDMLSGTPAEDLAFDQIDDLDGLAIDQSRLAELLNSVVNDFTNLDLQDFADPAMVENLSSIYQQADELADAVRQAAEDRLSRIDAYRLETETVELAEEILINCEAVLDFYDSIQFIAEIPEDQQIFAPLAELPDELVDLVGDLVTTEAEMAEDVEDIGSYLNSLDHTAGPVSDGTISSTSAKGVTGDQKPEDNIIQGRSGAGRSGMSEGQMVEAYAKDLQDNEYGLRERISNSPFESGRVEDDDVGAQTGGSGLGKLTDGATHFGLGGNVPPALLRQMAAVAKTQQSVLLQARQLLPKLDRYNLSTVELEAAIDYMEQVDKTAKGEKTGIGLKRAYNSSLDSLKKSHFTVGDMVKTRYIQSVAGNERMRLDGRQEQVQYEGYDDMIKAYFKALAQ